MCLYLLHVILQLLIRAMLQQNDKPVPWSVILLHGQEAFIYVQVCLYLFIWLLKCQKECQQENVCWIFKCVHATVSLWNHRGRQRRMVRLVQADSKSTVTQMITECTTWQNLRQMGYNCRKSHLRCTQWASTVSTDTPKQYELSWRLGKKNSQGFSLSD